MGCGQLCFVLSWSAVCQTVWLVPFLACCNLLGSIAGACMAPWQTLCDALQPLGVLWLGAVGGLPFTIGITSVWDSIWDSIRDRAAVSACCYRNRTTETACVRR